MIRIAVNYIPGTSWTTWIQQWKMRKNEENIYRTSNYITSIERGEVNAPNRNNTEHHKKKTTAKIFWSEHNFGRKKKPEKEIHLKHIHNIYIYKYIHIHML